MCIFVCLPFQWILLFFVKCPSLSSVTLIDLKSNISRVMLVFECLYTVCLSFHPFLNTFNLFLPLYFKYISYRQKIVGFCFIIFIF